jgi:chemotaxis family two-component system response regulator Rcp1
VLTRIKTDQHLRGIPVVILTTSSTDTDILRAYHLGANCYVSKPVGLDDFLRAIHGIENLWLNPARLPAYSPHDIL